jgi:hypothetical protein
MITCVEFQLLLREDHPLNHQLAANNNLQLF